ncbi:hypothetical protein B9Z65_4608 [Elsinoe australis]|uniref:Uncharacterized protein n=1 Tax=Elsinoe australis TaxID=40998 RepID=A0A2P8A5K4_9PEZI|nr:hypothetical protein B9Z65_4608 [Elsinoe australis]
MAEKEKQADFSFETVAALCCAILMHGGNIGKQTYDMMSALDGKRTANGFQHQFRAVLKRAKELQKMEGDDLKSVAAKPRANRESPKVPQTPKTPTTPKTSRVPKGTKRGLPVKDEEEDEDATAPGDEEVKRTKYEFDFPDQDS